MTYKNLAKHDLTYISIKKGDPLYALGKQECILTEFSLPLGR